MFERKQIGALPRGAAQSIERGHLQVTSRRKPAGQRSDAQFPRCESGLRLSGSAAGCDRSAGSPPPDRRVASKRAMRAAQAVRAPVSIRRLNLSCMACSLLRRSGPSGTGSRSPRSRDDGAELDPRRPSLHRAASRPAGGECSVRKTSSVPTFGRPDDVAPTSLPKPCQILRTRHAAVGRSRRGPSMPCRASIVLTMGLQGARSRGLLPANTS